MMHGAPGILQSDRIRYLGKALTMESSNDHAYLKDISIQRLTVARTIYDIPAIPHLLANISLNRRSCAVTLYTLYGRTTC